MNFFNSRSIGFHNFSYCLTVNKSQGQTLTRIGFYLPASVFLHGALYTAFSRVGNPFDGNLRLFMESQYPQGFCRETNLYMTRNIVFQGLLHKYRILRTAIATSRFSITKYFCLNP